MYNFLKTLHILAIAGVVGSALVIVLMSAFGGPPFAQAYTTAREFVGMTVSSVTIPTYLVAGTAGVLLWLGRRGTHRDPWLLWHVVTAVITGAIIFFGLAPAAAEAVIEARRQTNADDALAAKNGTQLAAGAILLLGTVNAFLGVFKPGVERTGQEVRTVSTTRTDEADVRV